MEKIGIIGGSGLYEIEGFENIEEKTVHTPFGEPSDNFICGTLNDVEAVFLARHGRGHRIAPSEINAQANLYGMKALGVTKVISVSAVGSFREELSPRDIVLIDQFFDRTKRGSEQTFFGNGIVAHMSFSDPICYDLQHQLYDAAKLAVADAEPDENNQVPKVHLGGTYLNMEGPAFSTKAESLVHKSWGLDVVGMTNLAEAKLAREAEMCYATMAMVTDYDAWHDEKEAVSVEMIINTLQNNAATAKNIIKTVLPETAKESRDCSCADALQNAVITDPNSFPPETRMRLDLFLNKYF